jgi:D-serine deaminase-like pyridoxal phosphate-dependent protein
MIEIIRPTLIVDKDVVLRNIGRMAAKAAEHKIRFRPHFKTHQSAKIGEWFRSFGVDAITVSSVQMAEYFAANGWNDISIAFPVNILEMGNINRLASKMKIHVLVENHDSATILAEKASQPIGVWIKIDTGYNRTGVEVNDTVESDSIVERISLNKNLKFKGFLTHTGQAYLASSTDEIMRAHFDSLMKLKFFKNRYLSNYPEIEISMGDTPSASICTNFNGVDEIRPGNFVFYDLMQQNFGVCSFEDIAVRMVCPVVSKHLSRNEIIIHGGAVHFSKDSIKNTDGKEMFGRIIIEQDGKKILLDSMNYLSKLSQEHGTLKVAQSQFNQFYVGQLIEIFPVHSCLTANLMGHYRTKDGDLIEMMPKY